MDFPADRYRRAGATPEEGAAHQASFDASPEGVQLSLVEKLSGMADADLRELVELGRRFVAAAQTEVENLAGNDADPAAGGEPGGLLGVVEPPGEVEAEDPGIPAVQVAVSASSADPVVVPIGTGTAPDSEPPAAA